MRAVRFDDARTEEMGGRGGSTTIKWQKGEQFCELSVYDPAEFYGSVYYKAKQCRRAAAALVKAAEEMEKEKRS